jgi:8-oxo-dGTP diphosphatase
MKIERFKLRSAVYLIPVQNNQILLSRRYNTGYMDGMYSLIAGHLDGDESVTQAMVREAREEGNLIIYEKDLQPATVLHRKSGGQEYVDFFFKVNKWLGNPLIMEPDKCDDLSWYPLQDLPKNTLPYIRVALFNLSNQIAFSAYGWE